MATSRPWRFLALVIAVLPPVASASDSDATPPQPTRPLHERIDALIDASHDGPMAARSTDAEFLRRVYLDLTGMIPTTDQARAFLDDPSPYKRQRLIDDLLERPGYARRMQHVFDVMLMERRRDQHVSDDAWRDYLYQSFARNKPYDQLVREILSADGSESGLDRAPARFLLDRDAEPNLLTRDIGRMFLGRDFQCAQCHDHPLVDAYKQAHYYGIYAFLSRSSVFTDPKTKTAMLAEKAEGDVTFSSVFKTDVTHSTGPRLLDHPPIEEPTIPKDRAYIVAPAKNVRSIPRYSRREQLAPALTSGEVEAFDRNIANRLWALMMKQGLVEPLDMHHPDNPPSHPELLDLLAREFRAMDYDIKAFLRELALSDTYQRSSEPPPGASEDVAYPWVFAVANLEPLTPEQLAWSMMQGLGIVSAYREQAERRIDTVDTKLRDILDADPERRARRAWFIEEVVHNRLDGNERTFIRLFGTDEGQPPEAAAPTVQQALFLSNDNVIQNWLKPTSGNLTGRLARLPDEDVAEELYLSVLSRRPSAPERREVAAYLADRGDDRELAIQELTWAVLTSIEFRFNH